MLLQELTELAGFRIGLLTVNIHPNHVSVRLFADNGVDAVTLVSKDEVFLANIPNCSKRLTRTIHTNAITQDDEKVLKCISYHFCKPSKVTLSNFDSRSLDSVMVTEAFIQSTISYIQWYSAHAKHLDFYKSAGLFELAKQPKFDSDLVWLALAYEAIGDANLVNLSAFTQLFDVGDKAKFAHIMLEVAKNLN